MIEPKPSLDEVYRRWRTANPIPIGYGSSAPPGWRQCLTRTCPVFIADGQERDFCYGCGGKPNAVRLPTGTAAEYRAHVKRLRRGRRLDGLPGRPYVR